MNHVFHFLTGIVHIGTQIFPYGTVPAIPESRIIEYLLPVAPLIDIDEIQPLHLAQIPHKDLKLGHLIFRPDIQMKNRIRTFNCDLLRL